MPSGVEHSLEGALIHQIMQVGERLAEGEAHLVPVERRGGTGPASVRPRSSGPRTRQSPRRSAPGDARQGSRSARAARRTAGCATAGPASRGGTASRSLRSDDEIAGEGIAVRLVRLDADIGRDLRQNLVARDQHAGLGAIEAGELGRMTLADDDLPLPPADLDRPCRRRAADSSPARRARRGDSCSPARQRARSPPRRARRDGRKLRRAGAKSSAPRLITRADSHSFSVIHNGACQRSVSQPASPIWSGW